VVITVADPALSACSAFSSLLAQLDPAPAPRRRARLPRRKRRRSQLIMTERYDPITLYSRLTGMRRRNLDH
jgi:hypothetical protein